MTSIVLLLATYITVPDAPVKDEATALVDAIQQAGGDVEYEGTERTTDKVVRVALYSKGNWVKDNIYLKLSLFPNLKVLFLSSDMLTDEVVEHLPPLPKLEQLSLWGKSLTGTSFKVLGDQYPELRTLNLRNDKSLADTSIAHLQALRHLEKLDCWGCSFSSEVGDSLKTLKTLHELDLTYNNKITDKCLVGIGALSDLHDLRLESTSVTDAGVANLLGLKRLQRLNLTNTKCTGACSTQIAKLESLEELDLCALQVKGQLAALKDCRKLKSLNLGAARMTDADLAWLKDAPQLIKLGLSGTFITDDAIAHCKGLENLRELSLSTNGHITDKSLTHLKECKRLQVLLLSRTSVTSGGVPGLLQSVQLPCLFRQIAPVCDEKRRKVTESRHSGHVQWSWDTT